MKEKSNVSSTQDSQPLFSKSHSKSISKVLSYSSTPIQSVHPTSTVKQNSGHEHCKQLNKFVQWQFIIITCIYLIQFSSECGLHSYYKGNDMKNIIAGWVPRFIEKARHKLIDHNDWVHDCLSKVVNDLFRSLRYTFERWFPIMKYISLC